MPDFTKYTNELKKKFAEEKEHLKYWQDLLAQRKKRNDCSEFYVTNQGTTPLREVYRQRDFIAVQACLAYDGQWLEREHFKPGSSEDPATWDGWRKVTCKEASELFPAAFIESLMVEVLAARLDRLDLMSVEAQGAQNKLQKCINHGYSNHDLPPSCQHTDTSRIFLECDIPSKIQAQITKKITLESDNKISEDSGIWALKKIKFPIKRNKIQAQVEPKFYNIKLKNIFIQILHKICFLLAGSVILGFGYIMFLDIKEKAAENDKLDSYIKLLNEHREERIKEYAKKK